MYFSSTEIVKANVKLPQGVYSVLRELANEREITISQILSEAISNYVSNESNILGNKLKFDFTERFKSHLNILKDDKYYKCYVIGLENLTHIKIKNNIGINKKNEVRRLIDSLYPDNDSIDNRRILKLLLYKEEIFDGLIKNVIGEMCE